jgi:EAL domain-containing protein (putative c-di-GMP-specific phosphodiesterase class I)
VLLDDFGKGSFNLVSLKYLPINELKLDMRFLSVEFEEIEQDLSILEFVINMAKKLNIKTVAEGVETKEQVEVLKKLGCDMAQGYIYQRPMPAKVYAALIASKTM